MFPRRPLPGLELSNGEYFEKQEHRRTQCFALCSVVVGTYTGSSHLQPRAFQMRWFGSACYRLGTVTKVSHKLDKRSTFDLHTKSYLPFVLVLFCLLVFIIITLNMQLCLVWKLPEIHLPPLPVCWD